jgi:hypothetical protein
LNVSVESVIEAAHAQLALDSATVHAAAGRAARPRIADAAYSIARWEASHVR